MNSKHGIATTHAGTVFRSRLEARWARFFDALGWQWEYEPFDVDGYIPDFAILGERPLLVEVKPALTLRECAEHIEKVARANRELLIVGAAPHLGVWCDSCEECGEHPPAGVLLQRAYRDEETPPDEPWYYDDVAHWMLCRFCKQPAIFHCSGSWTAYPCGHYDGDHYLGFLYASQLQRLWALVRNSTQWKPAK